MKFVFLSILKLLTLAILSQSAYALYINSDISSIESGEQFFSKAYVNNTNRTNLYNFTVYKIDRPGRDEKKQLIDNGEVIYTPLKKILLPEEQEFFKIFYRGKKDEIERYYKIIISETSLEVLNNNNKKKSPLFYPTISLDTYFVVRPVNPNFMYEFDQLNGKIKNTGNTYFRVLVHSNCLENNDDTPKIFYLLPEQSFQIDYLKKKSRKYIVIFDRYYSIGNCI